MDNMFAFNGFIENVVGFLLDIGLKATCLLAATALLACVTHRRLSAAGRHLIWLMGLLGALLIPVVSLPLRSHQIEIPTMVAVASAIQHGQVTAAMLVHAATHPNPAESAVETSVHISTPSSNPAPNHLFIQWNFEPAQVGISGVWLYGIAFVLPPLWAQILTLRKLRLRLLRVTVGNPMDDLAASALQMLGVTRPVEIRVALREKTVKIPSPVTWGTRHPVIVLPADAENWPEERLNAALLHEAAHIKRSDYLTMVLLARFVVALYWYNPLVWYAARRLRIESEQACDDLVLTAGHMAGPDYARCLLDVARDARRGIPAAVSMAQTSRIEQRLRTILNAGLNRQVVGERMRVAAGVTLIPVAGIASALCLAASPDDPRAVISLANGATVRVYGIAEARGKDTGNWWKPDGSLIRNPPQPAALFPKETPSSGTRYLAPAVAMTYRSEDQPRETWAEDCSPSSNENAMFSGKDVPPVGSSGHDFWVKPRTTTVVWPYTEEHLDRPAPLDSAIQGLHTRMDRVPQIFRVSDGRAQIDESVAAGPWTDVMVFPNKPGTTTVRSRAGGAQMTLDLQPVKGWEHLVSLKTYDWFPGTFTPPDRRLIAVDAQGHVLACLTEHDEVDLPAFVGFEQKTRVDASMPRALLPRVKEFRLLIRPFQHVVFRHVALNPQTTH